MLLLIHFFATSAEYSVQMNMFFVCDGFQSVIEKYESFFFREKWLEVNGKWI